MPVVSGILVLALWLVGVEQIAAARAPQGAQPATPVRAAPPQAEPADTLEGVTVTGRRRLDDEEHREAATAFVRELEGPTARQRLGRWERSLCPGVTGLEPAKSVYLLDRIAQEAGKVGLAVAEPGCKPDVLIAVTSEPDAYAEAFRRKQPRFFAERQTMADVGTDARGNETVTFASAELGGGGQRLPDFLESDRPVRWWHVSQRTENFIPNASRLYSPWREQFSTALVIVDAEQLQGVSWEQLAAYLAIVVLAQPAADAEPRRLESIMALFSDRSAGRPPAPTLTAWDRAYLEGLYAAPEHVRNLPAQRAEIQRRLERGRTTSR